MEEIGSAARRNCVGRVKMVASTAWFTHCSSRSYAVSVLSARAASRVHFPGREDSGERGRKWKERRLRRTVSAVMGSEGDGRGLQRVVCDVRLTSTRARV